MHARTHTHTLTHSLKHSRVVEVVRNEGGALEEAEDISRQRALEAASINPGGILRGQRVKRPARTSDVETLT